MPQMPDTRIAMGGMGGGQQQSNPFGTLGQMMQIKEQQSQMQARQREAELQQRLFEDDDATRKAVSQYERPDEAIDHLWREGRSSAASKLAQQVYTERKAKSEEYDAKLKSHSARLEQAAQIMQGVTDDASLNVARPAVVELVQPIYGDAINDYIPTTYDKAKIQRVVDAGTTRAQKLNAEHQATLAFQSAWAAGLEKDPKTGMWSPNGQATRQGYRTGLSNVLSLADNAEQWDHYRELAKSQGAPDDVIKEFGPWEADGKKSRERAMMLGLTGPQELTAANAARREDRLGADDNNGVGETGLRVSKTKRDDDNAKVEDWVREAFTEDNKRPRGVSTKDYKAPAFDVNKLSDANKAEFVRQKLQAENNHRTRINMPPLEEAAQTAAASGDVAGYNKVRTIFNSLTQGLVKLESVVPPPGNKKTAPTSRGASSFPMPGSGGAPAKFSLGETTTGAASTPAQNRARALALMEEKKSATPERRAEIDQELRSMLGR